jgi:hypothetical protein
MCELCCDNHGWNDLWLKQVAADKGCCREVCYCTSCSAEQIEKNLGSEVMRRHARSTGAVTESTVATRQWCPRFD